MKAPLVYEKWMSMEAKGSSDSSDMSSSIGYESYAMDLVVRILMQFSEVEALTVSSRVWPSIINWYPTMSSLFCN